MNNIQFKLLDYLKRQGINQKSLADSCQLSPTEIWRILHANPSLKQLYRVLSVLDLDLDLLKTLPFKND
ncbi:hypothetical protein [Capybara microvirus Cap3_SP_315]|nr:hypothetical protein [Capybara microvirus Cap3_SP_315]